MTHEEAMRDDFNVPNHVKIDGQPPTMSIEKTIEEIIKLKEENEQFRAAFNRADDLINSQMKAMFYCLAPSSVHEGVMSELFDREKEKFKTENNL